MRYHQCMSIIVYTIYTRVCVCARYMRLDAPIFQVDGKNGKNGINSGNATRISTTLNLTYHKLDLTSCELGIHGGSDVHASTTSSREGRVARRYKCWWWSFLQAKRQDLLTLEVRREGWFVVLRGLSEYFFFSWQTVTQKAEPFSIL